MGFFDKLKQIVAGGGGGHRRRSPHEKPYEDERSGGFYQPLPRQQPGSISRILCWKCGAANQPGARLCRRCGTAFAAASACAKCGERLSAKAEFCDECGERR